MNKQDLKRFLKHNNIDFTIHNHLGGVMFDLENLNIIRNKYSYGSERGCFEILNKTTDNIVVLRNTRLKRYILENK